MYIYMHLQSVLVLCCFPYGSVTNVTTSVAIRVFLVRVTGLCRLDLNDVYTEPYFSQLIVILWALL